MDTIEPAFAADREDHAPAETGRSVSRTIVKNNIIT
jgi:hypothetical protein